MSDGIRVTVWNEGKHEQSNPEAQKVYPQGMGHQIAQSLEGRPGIASVRVAQLHDPGQGLTDEILETTDVMTWWGHMAHHEVSDENAEKVVRRVVDAGMGLVVLHSGHMSKPFRALLGTGCMLKWRVWNEEGERERIWVVDPAHPIADGLPECIVLDKTEMYGEHFDIPQPDQQVFISWFQGGEVFRSGCCWHRGAGKLFYFRPGHETLPIFYNEQVLQVLYNGVRWARPTRIAGGLKRDMHPDPPEKIG